MRYNFGAKWSSLSSQVVDGGSFSVPYADFKDEHGDPTNQAYWQGRGAGDTQDTLRVGNTRYYASEGSFSVSFSDPANMVVTNTSGTTWASGTSYQFRPDRASLVPPMETQYASPAFVALPRPESGSPAIGSGDIGFVAYDDFLGDARNDPAARGAFEPD